MPAAGSSGRPGFLPPARGATPACLHGGVSVTAIPTRADHTGRAHGRRQWPHVPAAARPPVGPGLGKARARGAAAGHRAALPGRPRPQRLGQRVLRRRRPGRDQELEGVPLRVAGLKQLHHDRQAGRLPVGHGVVRPGLRRQLLEPACPAGPGGRGHGRRAVHHRAPLVRAAGRARRRRRHGARAGRHADVPVRRPGRAADADDHAGRLRHDAGHRVGPHPLGRADRGVPRRGLPVQVHGRVHGPARARARLPVGRAAQARQAHRAVADRRRRAAAHRRLVGRGRAAHAGRGPALHRQFHRQQHPQPDLRLQRVRQAHRQRDRQRRRLGGGGPGNRDG